MNITELRESLSALSQNQRDLLDHLIVAGDRRKEFTTREYQTLEELQDIGLAALDVNTSKLYYFATGLSDYFKVRFEQEFQ